MPQRFDRILRRLSELDIAAGNRRHKDLHGPPAQTSVELLAVRGTILREASLLPSDDLSAIMEQAFQRGLGHKLAPAVQMEQFAETFSNDEDESFDRQSIEVPWDLLAGAFTSHEDLRWQDGPGPKYSSDKANELLRTRYETLAQGLRITAPVLSRSVQFGSVVQSLRAQGWLDWHILTAVSNIAMNYRVGAHNSVVGTVQGFRAPFWDQESVHDAVHEDSASVRIAAGQRPRQGFGHLRVS